jgi:hypothetical protein
MWGRLATCGRLLIGLPRPARNLPGRWLWVCGSPLCGAGWQPAADWQSACRDLLVISHADGCGFAACRFVGRVVKPAADCQNRPAATTRKPPGAGASGCRLRPSAGVVQELTGQCCRARGRLFQRCRLSTYFVDATFRWGNLRQPASELTSPSSAASSPRPTG